MSPSGSQCVSVSAPCQHGDRISAQLEERKRKTSVPVRGVFTVVTEHNRRKAQRGENRKTLTFNQGVAGSIPARPTNKINDLRGSPCRQTQMVVTTVSPFWTPADATGRHDFLLSICGFGVRVPGGSPFFPKEFVAFASRAGGCTAYRASADGRRWTESVGSGLPTHRVRIASILAAVSRRRPGSDWLATLKAVRQATSSDRPV